MAPASRLLIASCGLLLASTSAAAAAAGAPKPSIVHVIADDLGFNDIWRYAADGTVEVDYRTSGGLGGVSPSWQNADGAIARGTFQRLDAEGRLGRTRRRLLGLPDEGAVPDC